MDEVELIKKLMDEFVSDGCGNMWHRKCIYCGTKTVEVVRPGRAECTNCGAAF